MEICLERTFGEVQTIGDVYVYDDKHHLKYRCFTLELPWRENQRRISCIPAGTYNVIKHKSKKFGDSFWVLNVPGRSEILWHYGNYKNDTLGCILPGRNLVDLNSDGNVDVTSSRVTMRSLFMLMPNQFTLKIEWKGKNPELS